ncbi:hypothetical protein [Pseudonocardia spinosispora]|uniref:hypothetical protein n=1 Tax=Pseudonocardia spinosispora TaxID=103441 RepID=UPI0003F720DE|nr:hypothetical protein [Pseudonocardia spinosispora]
MGNGAYLLVLFLGAVLVVIDGQLILRSSAGYLAEVYDNPKEAKQVAALVTVLFHLVMLGLVALIASVAFSPDDGVRSVLARVGVLLLVTAIGHALTIVVLSRMREQQLSTQLAEAQVAEVEHGHPHPNPAADKDGVLRKNYRAAHESQAPADKPAT